MKKIKSNRIRRAIHHINLNFTNAEKLEKLDNLACGYADLVQCYVDHIFSHNLREVKKFDPLPEAETVLSERYKRCAWQQAVGIMQSFFSNARENKPMLHTNTIQGNHNVIQIQPSKTQTFDYWLRISTLEKGKPAYIPIKMHRYGQGILEGSKLCSSVTLNFENGQWYATFVCETPHKKPQLRGDIIGVDLGITNLFTAKTGHFGRYSETLIQAVAKNDVKRKSKQKLNSCLIKKNKAPIDLKNRKLEGFVKNEIGRASNQFIRSLPFNPVVVLERLSIKSMRFKSRMMNRILKSSKIGYAIERLKEKLDRYHIRYASVPAAYSSQECSNCGYIDRNNRVSQSKFHCKFCGYRENADVNACTVIGKRFGDSELESITDYRKVKSVLLERFFRRFPGARSASGGLELGLTLREIGGTPLTVNQPP